MKSWRGILGLDGVGGDRWGAVKSLSNQMG
jgi:hypothetical protein